MISSSTQAATFHRACGRVSGKLSRDRYCTFIHPERAGRFSHCQELFAKTRIRGYASERKQRLQFSNVPTASDTHKIEFFFFLRTIRPRRESNEKNLTKIRSKFRINSDARNFLPRINFSCASLCDNCNYSVLLRRLRDSSERVDYEYGSVK